MAKPEWGTKRVCQSCAARFYDLGRSPIVCPNCGAVFDLEVLNRARRTRPSPRAAAVADEEDEVLATGGNDAAGAESDVEELDEDVEAEDDDASGDGEDGQEEDDSLIEDASELGEDEDMSDVIEGGLDEEEQR